MYSRASKGELVAQGTELPELLCPFSLNLDVETQKDVFGAGVSIKERRTDQGPELRNTKGRQVCQQAVKTGRGGDDLQTHGTRPRAPPSKTWES